MAFPPCYPRKCILSATARRALEERKGSAPSNAVETSEDDDYSRPFHGLPRISLINHFRVVVSKLDHLLGYKISLIRF